jgi:hypothetical protein
MTKEDTIEILDLIEDVLSRCTNELYTENSHGFALTTYVDPDKVRRTIRDIKTVMHLYGDNPWKCLQYWRLSPSAYVAKPVKPAWPQSLEMGPWHVVPMVIESSHSPSDGEQLREKPFGVAKLPLISHSRLDVVRSSDPTDFWGNPQNKVSSGRVRAYKILADLLQPIIRGALPHIAQ